MTRSITPGAACRLEFIVEDTDGLPVPSMTDADVSSAAYRNISAAGLASADTAVTLTSSAAYTAAVSAGQFVTIDSARGHYAIDCPSGAAGASAGYAQAVVAFTAGHTVTALLHEIDATGKTIADNLNATITSRASQESVNTLIDGIGWTLASLYGACANPQAADALVQLTINGYVYSGQYAGLTSTGVRTAPTLSKV